MKSQICSAVLVFVFAFAFPGLAGSQRASQSEDSPPVSTFKTLYNFCPDGSICADGETPYGGLVRDNAGNLYGTTYSGGAFGEGAVFKLDPSGHETVLYSFCRLSGCTDGSRPRASVIRDAMGNLYGTTTQGGMGGEGAIFKLDTHGTETVLYSFCFISSCVDGATPDGSLLRDSSGDLYGTTFSGGLHGSGTIFEISAPGVETVLYSFCSVGVGLCTDGSHPAAALTRDAAGNFYGTTVDGGNKYGTVFELDASGHESVLYTFCPQPPSCLDGRGPNGTLIRDATGNLYGTTVNGGSGGVGVVFQINPANQERVLHNFKGSPSDGALPEDALIEDSSGNFYGTTFEGGAINWGTVFKLTKTGKETILVNFGQNHNGGFPYASVIRDASGNLYGTTTAGGTHSLGTVFELPSSSISSSSIPQAILGHEATDEATYGKIETTEENRRSFKNFPWIPASLGRLQNHQIHSHW